MDSLDDMKIEEYLEKTGFAFMQVCFNDQYMANFWKYLYNWSCTTCIFLNWYILFKDQAEGRKIIPRPVKRKGGGKRKPRGPRDNEHMAGVLENYDGMDADSSKK